jgi:hypothetical protein
MKRIRKNDDGTETEFRLLEFDNNGPIRAEIAVASLDELRELRRLNKLISVRMIEVPPAGSTLGRQPQRNLAPWAEITDFTW